MAFWTYLHNRHPDNAAKLGAPNAASNQWLPIGETGLVLSLYIAAPEVGLFVRNARNVPGTRVDELLDPARDHLGHQLGIKDPSGNRSLWKSLTANTDDRDEWGRLADWLVEQSQAYLAAILQVVVSDQGPMNGFGPVSRG